jgi:hypothetical protein
MKQIVLILIVFFTFSCGSKVSEEQAEAAKKEVFRIHDEVMPLTMKIEDIQASVRKKYEKDASLKANGMAINASMQAATDSMYVWMGKLSNMDAMEIDERVKFLEIQKVKGKEIQTATTASIKAAEAFL